MAFIDMCPSIVVHGYVAGDKQLASPHINYVSILPFYIDASPGGNSQPLKAQGSHFKYSVHSSLCKYEPRLSFMPPKYLLLNTGAHDMIANRSDWPFAFLNHDAWNRL